MELGPVRGGAEFAFEEVERVEEVGCPMAEVKSLDRDRIGRDAVQREFGACVESKSLAMQHDNYLA